MTPIVSDIVNILESLAPAWLAEEWDNPGLQCGDLSWPVRRICVALDPSLDVVCAACAEKADLLITHHPLIFRALRSIDFKTPLGATIQMASAHRLAIFSAHTNLDSAADGLNDILAARVGLRNVRVMGEEKTDILKLVIYVPFGYEEKILSRLFTSGAGKIGAYACCSFRSPGKGTFRPEEGARPFLGKTGQIVHADETRIEVCVPKNSLERIIREAGAVHPYETMAYDAYPLFLSGTGHGLGRIGDLEEKTTLTAFAQTVKLGLDLKWVKVAGDPALPVRRVAVCTGSGSSLMNRFLDSGAQVYLSGDLHYHDARLAEAHMRGLVDIGHFASEHLLVPQLSNNLRRLLSDSGMTAEVFAFDGEKDPFSLA